MGLLWCCNPETFRFPGTTGQYKEVNENLRYVTAWAQMSCDETPHALMGLMNYGNGRGSYDYNNTRVHYVYERHLSRNDPFSK